jgi:hypothetical protein
VDQRKQSRRQRFLIVLVVVGVEVAEKAGWHDAACTVGDAAKERRAEDAAAE